MMLLAEIYTAQIELIKARVAMFGLQPSQARTKLLEKTAQLWDELEKHKKDNSEV